ncbi:MAG: hypothetical protein ABIO61_10560 [Thermomonas sp.]
MTRRNAILLGCIGVLLLSAVYCLPSHPSAGNAAMADAIAHVALFAAVGGWFGWFAERRVRVFIPLAALAALLEVGQWWILALPAVEWHDVLANEAGLVVALLALRWRERQQRVA